MVKVRDGQVANRPIYAAIDVSLDGQRLYALVESGILVIDLPSM